jgi:hypothetical protein
LGILGGQRRKVEANDAGDLGLLLAKVDQRLLRPLELRPEMYDLRRRSFLAPRLAANATD